MGRLLLLVAAVGLAAYLFADTARWLAHQWWTGEYYSHGPLVVAVAAMLGWRERRGLSPAPSWTGPPVLLLALGGHLGAMALRAPFLSALTIPLGLAGAALFWGGWPALRRWAFPLAFLVLAVPLPFVDTLAFPLQVASAQAASALANVWGVPATFQGGQVALEQCALTVGAPCSGLRSAMAMLSLGALAAWALQGPLWGRGLLLVLAVPAGWLANVLRVTALLAVAHGWGAGAALGTFHTLSSPLFFLGGVAMLVAVAWGTGCRDLRPDW